MNLRKNIYRNKTDLAKVKTEVELYHEIYTQPKLHVGAAHCLAKIAYVFCSEPPESIVESMGRVIEKIKNVRGAPKSSLKKKDVGDTSDELIIHWNGPPINTCESVVRQTLNLHFKGQPWHFTSTDIRAKFHKVSMVVDRLKTAKPSLSFMA